VCLTGCEIWTRQDGVASLGGTLYPFMSLSGCLKLCLDMSTCVAVDYSVAFCAVHTNINVSTFSASDTTRYILNRACQASTATSLSSISSPSTAQTSTESTYFGK